MDWAAPLRLSLKAHLASLVTLAGGRIEAEQADPMWTDLHGIAGNLPKVCIYTPEDVIPLEGTGTRLDATVTLVVDCWSYGVATLDESAAEVAANARDALAYQVLGALLRSWDAPWSRMTSVKVRRGVEKRGDVTYGCSQILVTASHPVCVGEVQTEDMLEHAALDYDVADAGGPDEQIEISQTVTFPQGDDA